MLCACESTMSFSGEMSDICAMGQSAACYFQQVLCSECPYFNLLSEGLCYVFSIWRNIVVAASESLNGISFNRFLFELLFLPSTEYSPFPQNKNIFALHFCDTCACAHVCLNKYVYMFDVCVAGSVHE